jgi:hypothetical protein
MEIENRIRKTIMIVCSDCITEQLADYFLPDFKHKLWGILRQCVPFSEQSYLRGLLQERMGKYK